MVSKKNKRKIVVNEQEYWWQVHYDKDWVRPYIYISSDLNKLLLKQSFDQETFVSSSVIETLIKANSL